MMDRETFDRVIALSRGERLSYDSALTWVDLFAEQVRIAPENTAVVAEDGSLSYAELDRLSDRLALSLVEVEGVKPDEFIAVRMGRVKAFHIAALAIHKAGAAYMPIDLEYPADRVAYMMEDSGARLTLTEQSVARLLEGGGEDKPFAPRCHPDSRAYMIYTSGSTGKPKGVVIPHRALTNFVHFIARRWGLSAKSRIALHSNFAFDAAVEDLFPALTVGGTVFVVPESARKDVFEMRAYIKENRINGGSYSTQFGQLLAMDEPLDVDYLCMGGEAMTIVPQARGPVYNVYGPTEFTVDATYYELEKGREYAVIPIGRPLYNCSAYIVDDKLDLLPPGETGELCLSGPQLAEGYWNRPELTAAAFTALKLSDEETVRVYRTGDLARWNDEGQLEFCGRIDTQVKLRGFRVELGEVESRAAKYPGIRQAAAEVRNDTLCLYYTASGDVDEAALAAHMAESLAEYMVPGAFIRLDAMPMNVNGKIDRRALPDPVIRTATAYVAPATEAEAAVAAAMARVLGVDESTLGVTHDFFEMGGDSIKAIRLVSALRKAGYAASVAEVMQRRTARALAAGLASSGDESVSQAPFEGEVADTAIFAFFKDLDYPAPAYYNQSTLLQWRGWASLAALQAASDAITAQHDMLRAVIRDGHLFVRPADSRITIEEYTLEDDAEAIRAKCEDIQSHLNVEAALVRQALIHAGGRDLFFLTAHHTIVDGVSWRIWLDDLETAYGQASKGEPVQLPAKTNTYRDYADAMKAYRSGYALSLEIPYWKRVEAKMLQLPTSANKDYARRFEQLNVSMSEADTEAFTRAKLSALRLEVNDLLLAALGQGYREVFGADAVSVSMEGHGRENLGRALSIDRAIGWFTSVYPVVLEGFTGDAGGDLTRVKETLRAVPSKGVGYNILAFVKGEPEVSFQTERAPLVTFNYLGDVSGESSGGEYFDPDSADGFSAGLDYYDPRNHDGSDLVINCLIDGGRFSLWLDYNADRFEAAQARAFGEAVLQRITALGGFLSAQAEPLPPTASDLGETEWTPEEFNEIAAQFAARGEALLRIYPLTPMQEGMLLEHVAHPESLAYRLIDIYECGGPLDEARLRHAVDALARRHEVLRTAIIHKGVSRYRQAVTDRRLPLRVVNIAAGKDPFAEAKKIRLELLHSGYDLQDRPLTQFVYVTNGQAGFLVFATHHIITDGWCFETMLRDLNALLRGEDLSGSSDGQYERAVRELLQRDRAQALRYFGTLFAGYENSAAIPSHGSVPEAERDAEDQFCGVLSAEKTGALAGLCRSAGATLADGFNLAWGMVLRTANRLSDVAFTAIASGRDGFSFDVSDLVGLFINPVPVRVDIDRTATARQMLESLRRQAVATLPNDFCPLADIQKALGNDVRLGGVVISFENYATPSGEKPLLKPALIREEHEAGDVSVDASVQPDGSISVLLSYDPALYRGIEMQRLYRLFENYVERMTAQPDAPLSSLKHLSDADRADVLALSQGETFDYDAAQTWVDLFKAQAASRPDALAVSAENGSLTYAELDRLSDKLAARLVAAGVTPDAFVAVRLGRVKEFHVAALAIHKAGAAYMPIDMDYPEERAQYMIEDSGAALLLTEEKVAELLSAESGETPFEPLCAPDRRAYMIYTSGSTGKPKGVVIRHRGLTNLVHFIARRWGLTARSRVALHSNFAFDAAVEDLFSALIVGGAVFVVPERARKDIFEMRAFIEQNRINGGSYSTQFGQLLGADAVLDLDYICVGGEAMTSVPQCRGPVYNTYGPTEFTVDAVYCEIEKGRDYHNIPIGRPLYNCAACVLDDSLEPLPRGMVGELCLAGPQLAEGYWNRPDLTAKAFVEMKGPGNESLRIYRTGDLARWNEADQLEYYGRIDTQVKLRGFRVELGEIENVALGCAGVASAAAEVKKQTLCLYYSEKPGERVDVDALRGLCAQKLADYMVPAVFMRLDAMPMTINGKINRKALPMPEFEDAGDVVAPDTETEKRLYAAAQEILGTDGFGVMGDLTKLGLTSISAMRLSSTIAHLFSARVTVADILRAPTVRALSKQIDGAGGDENPRATQAQYPLSMTQMGIYVDSARYAGSTIYNIPYLYKLDDGIDIDRLRAALDQVIKAHPCLSMAVRRNARGEAVAVCRDDSGADIPVLDTLPPLDALARPFDLDSGEPLYRAELYDTAAGKYLFLDTHHIVSDGASIDILMADINTAYAGGAVEKEAYTGYDFALDEQAARASERFAAAKAWYDGVCRGCEPCTQPAREADRETTAEQIAYATSHGQTSADAIRSFCEAHGFTPNAFFTTAFALALKAYTGSESAVFCTIYNGRIDPRTERSVCMFVKTLPVVAACEANQPVAEAVSACQSYLLNAMSNDIFSFAEISDTYGIRPDVIFVYQGEHHSEVLIGGQPAEIVDLPLSRAKEAFLINASLDGDRILYEAEYDPALYGAYTMDGFVRMLDVVCGELLARETIRDVRLTTAADERAIEALYDTDCPVPARPAYRLLQDSAEKYPDRMAVAAVDRTMTYRELNGEANALGRALVEAGAGPDAMVVVMADRNSYAYVMRQGVLKSGGAFLPVDPEYPEERVSYILENCGAKLLVTTAEILGRREALFAKLRENGVKIVEATAAIASHGRENLNLDVPGDALCYVIYTSGSTGRPKGAMLTNRSLVNYVDDNEKNRPIHGFIQRGHVSLAVAALTFDYSVHEEFVPLANGMTVVLATQDQIMKPTDLAALMRQYSVDVLNGTPRYLSSLLTMDCFVPVVQSLKVVLSAAEAFPAALYRKLVEINPELYILNGYGPTETTIICVMEVVESDRNITIGRTTGNAHVATMDRDGRLQPLGATGELIIMGEGVGRGYVANPALTEKSFFTLLGRRAYHSGDLARLREDGKVEYHGRIDNQVKLRGLRIELGEVESVLNSYPGVQSSVVIVNQEHQCLAAYFTADSHVDISDLKKHLSAYLTAYMVPQSIRQLDEMPLTANGKIDKKALPPIEFAEAEIVPPENDTQRKILSIVAEALGQDRIGVTTDLFEAGLNSIGSIALCSRLSEAFNKDVRVSDVFDCRTIKGLEALLRGRDAQAAHAIQADYPLSMTQMGIFTDSLRMAGTTVYNVPVLYRLDPGVDLERLRAALGQLIQAHPCLSMTLRVKDGSEVRAVRNAPKPLDIPIRKTLPASDNLVRPFDLTSGEPLYRAELFDAPEGKFLFLDIHHIIYDGASVAILMDDLNAAYAGGSVEPEAYTGFEFALDEQTARASERLQAAKAWYDGVCRGCPPRTLPVREMACDPGAGIGTGSIVGETAADAVRAYCDSHGLTPNAFFTTAFALALKAYTGSESAVFCTIYNGRSDPRMARSVGMFVKTLPVVADCAADQTVEAAVSACQIYLLNAMANDIFSFAEIKETYGIEPDVLFAYQGEQAREDRIGGLPAEAEDLSLSQAKSAFGLDVSLDGSRVVFDLEYDPALYTAYTVDGFARMLDVICGEMLKRERLGDIRLTSEAEEQAIKDLHDTDWPVEVRPAYRLLQDAAAQYPDRTALIAVDRRMTYEQLNAEANAMGQALSEAGAGPERVVAVMADRNSLAYVMRQGALKSGGAFMPIDPEYPVERVRYILEDSGAKLLAATREILDRRGDIAEMAAELGVTVILADEAIPSHSRENLNVPLTRDALCYVIYTSGSTGKPKGVMLTQQNLVNFVDSDQKNREIQGYTTRGHVSLAIAALTFDFAIMEEFVPLANGMTVVLATKEQMMNPAALSELMLNNGVDVMSCTPSYMSNMLAMAVFVPAVRALKSVDFGAEAFPSALYGKLRAVNPNLNIMNGYGPTEATISCTMEVLDHGEDITIGIPNVNVHVATLDRDGRLQPLGAMGEMVIMGEGVGRGYVGREELTQRSFFTLLGRRAYRSGDLVRLRRDSQIEYHGRMDNQVKLRGLRIELGEIENVLNAYPGVRTSIAVVNLAAESIVAYFTADRPIDIQALRTHMSAYLAAYMMPAALMQLDEMPLTANGKIDKKALPPIDVSRKERVVKGPETELQAALCDMFQKALGLDAVGVDEDFFELGGTSLKAATVLMSAMLNDLPITYQDIFNAPTVRKLEALVQQKRGEAPEAQPQAQSEAAPALGALAHNRNEYVDEIEAGPLGGVLLTGATGFLGAHVLRELIDHTDEKVYCLVRAHGMDVKQKLASVLYYYFDSAFEDAFGSRLFVVEGDIENPETLAQVAKLDYHTVINCAACVKHFADINFLMSANFHAVENLTRLCIEKGARLVQISTVSVGGDALGGLKQGQILREDGLELGQEVQANAYVYTKYLAERHVLEAIEKDGLDAKIIRAGNLSSRVKDGEFQMNFRTNAFMNSLRAYAVLGCYPISAMSDHEEISYIDETARAVVLLSGTNRDFTVFHAYNGHTVEIGDIIAAMNACGIPVEAVTTAEYDRRLREGLAREDINSYLSTLIDYALDDSAQREEIPADNGFTVNALYRLGMRWTITDMPVIEKMIRSLQTLGFFDCAAGAQG